MSEDEIVMKYAMVQLCAGNIDNNLIEVMKKDLKEMAPGTLLEMYKCNQEMLIPTKKALENMLMLKKLIDDERIKRNIV